MVNVRFQAKTVGRRYDCNVLFVSQQGNNKSSMLQTRPTPAQTSAPKWRAMLAYYSVLQKPWLQARPVVLNDRTSARE